MHQTLSLNGTWYVDYMSDKPYTEKAMPEFKTDSQGRSDRVVKLSVPGYWEDNLDVFRTTALHSELSWNPEYTLLRYPHAGYSPDMQLANPVGTFLYKRTFTFDKKEGFASAELYVGGVQNTLSAWINGVYLGRHEGYSSEFFLPVPEEILADGENSITLAVSNTRFAGYDGNAVSGLTTRASNNYTGGIWGDVELRVYADGLRDVWVSTAPDLSHFTVKADGAMDKEKTVRIYDGKKQTAEVKIPAGKSEISIAAASYTLWTPSTPKLYTATVSTEKDNVSCRFGVRRLTSEGNRLYLNGAPYFFRGICEHCYHAIDVHPPREKSYYRSHLRTLKELGFNSIRFHTHVPMPEYAEAADEIGFVIEVETPNNTSYAEWQDIVKDCRHHASVCAYSSGNEMLIDEAYIEHLRACADFVHAESDSLFSPMSAMRGVEYFSFGDCKEDKPFPHNPKRLAALDAFCDLYNSYSLGQTSYRSESGDSALLNERNALYKRPILSHEICIHGTYCDLSLMNRYEGTRIGETEFMSSVKKHLEDVGLLDRANLYYRNSSSCQSLLRKHCFETIRRTDNIAGYDFLGDIDTHWHTFGYCVGMMNEFYEMKPGETAQNVRRYNSDTVLLADLPRLPNLVSGQKLDVPILVSHYGKPLDKATLRLVLREGEKVLVRREIRVGKLACGAITPLYTLPVNMPRVDTPVALTLSVALSGGDTDAENEWTLYVFPKASGKLPTASACKKANLCISRGMDADELVSRLERGENVLIFGAKPFASESTIFQLALAGRTGGHLGTAIADHPIFSDFPNDGFCGWQFREMLSGGRAVVLDLKKHPHRPILDMATTYKNARREAMLFEYKVGIGKLLVCSLNLTEGDPGAMWLKERILAYAMSEEFAPTQDLTVGELHTLCSLPSPGAVVNTNEAQNKNDITMKVK